MDDTGLAKTSHIIDVVVVFIVTIFIVVLFILVIVQDWFWH